MTTTIADVFDLPRQEDIRAMGFVIKLREAPEDEVRQLVDDYVVTPAVERELPQILDVMKQIRDRGEEYGRFVHGSFGSGKSHFLTLLSLLLEGSRPAWDKLRPIFDAHRAALEARGREAPDPESWIPAVDLLVVRLHMISVRGRTTGLDRAVYDAFNRALKSRGKAPFEFLNVDAVFDEVRREAEMYGDIVWKNLETAGIVGGREDFEALAGGSERARERFARAWLEYKERDVGEAGIDPRWTEGLKRMGAHAKAQGFGGIVLMIDEILLWLGEKEKEEFTREINNLVVIMDHDTGQRPLPIFVFVALQRDLREFYPDLVEESRVHEEIDHHAKRFETTQLQDVELRHIVKGRVLRVRDTDAVKRAVDGLAAQHQKLLPALLAGSDFDYLRDVYPFHPALIEMLVDVTSLMQRERSALRLLYELLAAHPDLPLGEFLPVGSAFGALFPEAGVEASKKPELMQDIHHQYYRRLRPTMTQMVDDAALEVDQERRRALDQLVRTVLLAEVSPRLKQSGLTVERLVQLNSVDVEGETYRGRVRVAETDLLELSQRVPDLQVAGQGKTAVVRYVLGKVSLGEILARARSRIDNEQQRFQVFWPALKAALGLTSLKGFEEGGANEGDWHLVWRRTRRRGQIKLGNVREMSYEDFEPVHGTFKVLVDYPWDEKGHTVGEDRMRAENVRKKKGVRHTVCWLPRHMSPAEISMLTELAAVRFLLTEAGQEELLETLGPKDRAQAIEQAEIRERTLSGQLDEKVREIYVHDGEFLALISDVDSARPQDTLAANLEHVATRLMDRRYPRHPNFGAEPKKADLETLLKWMVEAVEASVSVGYDDAAGKVLKTLGQPLELVNLGQTKAALRVDSPFIKDVEQRTDQDSVAWAPVAEHLRDTYGLPPLVIDLFLCFLCQRNHRALHAVTGEPIDVRLGMSPGAQVRLQRGALLGAPEWHRLRDLGHELFDLRRPPNLRSLQGQDRFALALGEAGRDRRAVLQGLHERIVHLGVDEGDRLDELTSANERLKPLGSSSTDSFQVLTELLGQWPDDPSDPLRKLVRQVESIRDALAGLNENVRRNLQEGTDHPEVGTEVSDHLVQLDSSLKAAQEELPLTADRIRKWNRKSQELIRRLIVQPPLPPPPPPPPDPDPQPSTTLCRSHLDPADSEAVEQFLGEVRSKLEGLGRGTVEVSVIRREAGE